jgi:hypothetical protein
MKKTLGLIVIAIITAAVLQACGGGGGGGGGDKKDGGDSKNSSQNNSNTTTITTNPYALTAWNDLGMHCVDGNDYSIMSILPPYNNLHAQLVDTKTNKQVTTGVTLTYEAIADLNGSINTYSTGGAVAKTNFWSWVQSLFGGKPADNKGLNLDPAGPSNPTPSKMPAAMTWNATNQWFGAEGIPVTPVDDAGKKNFYPMVKVIAKNTAGTVLASTMTVLPVSDEMTCIACHASRVTGTGTAAQKAEQLAARPTIKGGWVAFNGVNADNLPSPVGRQQSLDEQKDWKLNILRIHDQLQTQRNPAKFATALQGNVNAGTVGYYDPAGLEATALAGKPILCAGCHDSNALNTDRKNGISALTSALHTSHASVQSNGMTLDNNLNRGSCYMCHPGSVTLCLRGAMSNVPNTECQSCHGNMTAVGNPARKGWLDQPNCQACHHDGLRETSAIDLATGKLRVVTDPRYATNPNTPSTGLSLFRFSTDHKGLQCEACHGPTHAEYPSTEGNDNVQSVKLQGHSGTIRECAACHASIPTTGGGKNSGGPHGMHEVGQNWVSGHQNAPKGTSNANCKTCHGANLLGGPLSEVRQAQTINKINFPAGWRVGCDNCHTMSKANAGSGNPITVTATNTARMNPAYLSGGAGAAQLQKDKAISAWLVGK